MSFKNSKTILGSVSLLAALFCGGAAWGAVEDYILKGDQVYRIDGDMLDDEEPVWKGTAAGLLVWALVDPELTEEMKGSDGGIYFR